MDEMSKRLVNADDGSNYIPKTISEIIKKMSMISDPSVKESVLELHLCSYENEIIKVDSSFKRIEKLQEENLKCSERETGAVMKQETVQSRRTNVGEDERARMSLDLVEKRDWMSSAQLWSTPVEYENNFTIKSNYRREGPSGLFKSSGGAFVPFKKAMTMKEEDDDVAAVKGSRGLVIRPQPQQPQLQRKQRRCWSPQLHCQFVDAVDYLGGAEVATPKRIREQMKVEGLTNDEVKSHLQKFRIHIRRLATAPSTGPSELPLFGLTDDQPTSSSADRASSHDHGF